MREKKRRRIMSRALIRGLGEDIKSLVKTNEGLLLAMEIIDEIPRDLRPHVIDGLASFGLPEMIDFFHVIKEEYGKEMEAACNRGLEKLQMKGVEKKSSAAVKKEFFKAYVTRTRHTGQVTLDVAWVNEEGLVDVECFFLSYNADGIHGFFVISEMPIAEYEADRRMLPDMIRITYEEACCMIKEAYCYNIKYMTRPALGKFLYRKYLETESTLSSRDESDLVLRLSPELDPRELVNTFFYAQRYKDRSLISSIMTTEPGNRKLILSNLEDMLKPDVMLVEGQAVDVKVSRGRSTVKAYSIHVEEESLYRSDFSFELVRNNQRWFINAMNRDGLRPVNENREGSPFQDKVHCYVYEILDLERLFETLEEFDNIREVGELPFGVHLRLTELEECVGNGVFFLSDVMADLVINGDELVIIARNKANAIDIDDVVVRSDSVEPLSHHQVEIITAYTYLSGQYLSFQDMLRKENQELFFEDGLKLLTARYSFKDKEKVHAKLKTLQTPSYKFPGAFEVYYEYENNTPGALRAEYVLGNNWVTVSAFGEKDLSRVREQFEDGLREYLEYEGMEIKCEGIFELITVDVKKQYPELEDQLKKAYLEKWFESKLKPLRGMSPQDAAKSIEGKRLLWTMFKDMKRNEKLRQDMGVRNVIQLKQYMQKVDIKEK
ncbi:MAG: hypothetical protein ACM3UW_05445 [Bacillota bacterium]